jgi:hypothetical protein
VPPFFDPCIDVFEHKRVKPLRLAQTLAAVRLVRRQSAYGFIQDGLKAVHFLAYDVEHPLPMVLGEAIEVAPIASLHDPFDNFVLLEQTSVRTGRGLTYLELFGQLVEREGPFLE